MPPRSIAIGTTLGATTAVIVDGADMEGGGAEGCAGVRETTGGHALSAVAAFRGRAAGGTLPAYGP